MPNDTQSGHLYVQTSAIHNAVIHFLRASDGTITEADRVSTGGAGSGPFNYRATPPGLIVEGANSVLMTPDKRMLFAINGGDNSVSSFGVAENGKLTLLDIKRTGNAVTGKSGTAKSLEYAPSSRTLYVLHTFGPEQIRLFSVDSDGYLSLRPEGYSAVPADKPGRVTTMLTLSPSGKFLLVGCSMDELPATNPDGSPILWVTRNGQPHAIAANAPDPDGLAVFPIDDTGALGGPTTPVRVRRGARSFCTIVPIRSSSDTPLLTVCLSPHLTLQAQLPQGRSFELTPALDGHPNCVGCK